MRKKTRISVRLKLALLSIAALCVLLIAGCKSDDSKDVVETTPVDAASLDAGLDTATDVAAVEETTADSRSVDVPPTETTPDTAGEEVIVSGLPTGVYELAGFDPSLPLDDLVPLSKIIGDTPIVALGESFHTSKGYYQTKHRVFNYLVEEKGFRVLAFESYWTPAKSIEAYVQTCEGDLIDVTVENLIKGWTGQSVADLIQWMCEYNQAHPDDPVHFVGYDIQQTWLDGPALMSFLELAAPDVAEDFNEGIAKCRCTTSETHDDCSALYGELGLISDEEKMGCLDALGIVETWMNEHETEVVKATSTDELEYAKLHLLGIKANIVKNYHNLKGEYGDGYESRDWGMTQVFNKLREMEFPDAKIAIWAHNWHIAHRTDLMTEPAVVLAPVPMGLKACKGMGTFLHEQLGDDYMAIGLHSYKLSVNWEGLYQGEFEPHTDESLEGLLHALERPMLLVDLAFPGAEAPFLEQGAKYPAGIFDGAGGAEFLVVPAQQYGAIIFIDESPMMDALMW